MNTIKIEFTETEALQLLLSVAYRISGLGQMMVNAVTKESEKAYSDMAEFLTALHTKLTGAIQVAQKDTEHVESAREKKN